MHESNDDLSLSERAKRARVDPQKVAVLPKWVKTDTLTYSSTHPQSSNRYLEDIKAQMAANHRMKSFRYFFIRKQLMLLLRLLMFMRPRIIVTIFKSTKYF